MDLWPLNKRIVLPLLVAIFLLAAGVRFHRIEAQSFWNDEGNSARIAERPIALIIEGAAGDIHPPGYYLLLAGWRALAGQSEFALRMLSALAGVLTVAVVFRLGSDLFDRPSGLFGALAAALSPFQVYYGQEARMYALVALLSALSIWLTAKALSLPGKMMVDGRLDRREALAIFAAYIVTNTAGLYTHYSFPLILAAETLIFGVWLVRRAHLRRRSGGARSLSPLRTGAHGIAVWGGLHVPALILFGPWIPQAIRQIATWPRGGSAPVDPAGVMSALAYGVTLPVEVARYGLLPLILLALVGLLPPADPADRRRTLGFGERIGLIGAWLVAPVLALAIAGALSESFLKFLLPSNLALALLAARGWVVGWDLGRQAPGSSAFEALLSRAMIVTALMLGLLPAAVSLGNLYGNPAYARDNYRAAAGRILSEAGPGAGVILDAPNQWEVFTYYFPDGPNVAPLPNASTAETLDRLLSQHGRIYALYWGEAQQDPDQTVRRTLEANAFEAGSEWYGGIQLVIYAVTGAPADQMEAPSGAQFVAPGEGSPRIVLDGYTLSAAALSPGEGLGVTLFWHTDTPLEGRYKVFMHMYSPDGALIAQHDSEPGSNLRPTDTWEIRERITDPHGLLLPLDAPPGEYRLVVGLYGLIDGVRLAVEGGAAPNHDSIPLASITVE